MTGAPRQRASPPPPIVATGLALLAALLALPLVRAPRAEGFVYWTNTHYNKPPASPSYSIGRANLDGSGVDPDLIDDTGTYGSALAVDASHIYYNGFFGSIGRANLDTSSTDPGFMGGAGGVDAVAVDAGHIYWTPGFANTIGRANPDGTGVDQSFITTSGVNPPNDVAVDPTHIYWTIHSIYDSFPYPGTIGRANLDGSGIDPSFISGVNYPVGVAVDANHIYWASDVEGTIGRANLDGSGIDRSFISGAGAARDVAVDAGHVYWTDFDAQTIGRANLDGSGIDRSFISGAGAVDDLTVDALTVPETTITSGPRGTTNDASPSFGFRSSQPGASFRCRLESVAWKACASPKSYSRLAGGLYRFEVRAVNVAGADPTPASRSFTVDTVASGRVSAVKAQQQHGKRIVVKAKVKAKESLTAKATGKIKINPPYKLKPKKVQVAGGKTKTLKLKPNKEGQAKRIAAALKQGEKATAKLTVKLTDQAGNSETEKLRVRLKR